MDDDLVDQHDCSHEWGTIEERCDNDPKDDECGVDAHQDNAAHAHCMRVQEVLDLGKHGGRVADQNLLKYVQ